MELFTVQHSSKCFTYVKPERKLIAEISTLEANNPQGQAFGRVYDDACDEGLTIVSERTGERAVFHVDQEVRDNEGELQCWILKPTRDTQRRLPKCKGMAVVILND